MRQELKTLVVICAGEKKISSGTYGFIQANDCFFDILFYLIRSSEALRVLRSNGQIFNGSIDEKTICGRKQMVQAIGLDPFAR